ncbi:MAG: hypothetical protein V1829_00210 [bacterium]
MYLSPKISVSLALASLVFNLFVPQPGTDGLTNKEVEMSADGKLATFWNIALIQSSNPDLPKVASTQSVLVTAYSSTPDQTDSTPFITASGTRVHDGTLACNFLKFGTRVRFPELYGDKIFVVEDRMALKNSHKMDIWFSTRWEAIQFGARIVKVEVLGT